MCKTFAAAQLALPACVAWLVQVPAATSVTVAPDTVHTVVVALSQTHGQARRGGRADGERRGAECPIRECPAGDGLAPLGHLEALAHRCRGGPVGVTACVAWIVQVPAATSVEHLDCVVLP